MSHLSFPNITLLSLGHYLKLANAEVFNLIIILVLGNPRHIVPDANLAIVLVLDQLKQF
jgi:hypothetical protein